MECAKDNGREHNSCLGRVFNFKLDCSVMNGIAWLKKNLALTNALAYFTVVLVTKNKSFLAWVPVWLYKTFPRARACVITFFTVVK